MESGLENIDPESFAQNEAISLLMGRPIALVRASVSLELQGMPAIDQSWHAFRRDLKRQSRETAQFENLEFPVRIGEYRQLNDGLVGYWIEDNAGFANDLFYAPKSDLPQGGSNPAADHIISHNEGTGDGTVEERHLHFHRWLSVASEPLFLTMLIGPRGKVHATSGILPTKEIHLLPDQYKAALQEVEVSFLTAPILTPANQIHISLPQEPGYGWAWLAKEQGGWTEKGTVGRICKSNFFKAFASAPTVPQLDGEIVWDLLIAHGWLSEQDDRSATDGLATVQPETKRKEGDWA